MQRLKNVLAIIGAIYLIATFGWVIERAINEKRAMKLVVKDNLGGTTEIPIDGKYAYRLVIFIQETNRLVTSAYFKENDE